MRIGELSKKSGLSRDTLRYYERQGLITSEPEGGESNTYRAYPDATLLTLEWIAEAQSAGMTLADLTVLIGQLDAETGEDFDGFAFLDQKITEVEERIAMSKRFLETLRDTKKALKRAPYR